MRHAPHRGRAAGEPGSFWNGAFTDRMDRCRDRGAHAPALLRRATPDEIASLLAEARGVVPIGATEGVWPMVAKNPDIVRAICTESGPTPAGIFAYLPLNHFGAEMIVTGQLDGGAPDPAWICRRHERPEAIYWWLIHSPGLLFRVLGAIAALFEELAPDGVPVFSRAMSAASERLQHRMGFIRARSLYPEAPDWLLVALPEGRVPSRRIAARPMRLEVKMVRTMEDLAKIFSLRSATYIAEQFCTYEEEFDGNDLCSTQLLGSVDGDPAGCIRLRYFGGFAKLERLCVRREYRSIGLKEKLIHAALDHARAKSFRLVYGHARADLVEMWARFGFRPVEGRPAFRFANIDYVEIIRELEPDPKAIRLGVPPMMTVRPEGSWDEAGPLDLSNIDPDPARLALIAKHARLRT